MKIRAGLLLAALVAVFSPSSAGAALAEVHAPARIVGVCNVAFVVTSTLHDFTGSARCLPFEAALDRDAAGGRSIPTVEVEVPVGGMDTGIASRNGKMREMFRSDRFPRIHGVAHDVDVDRLLAEMGKGRGGNASIELLIRIRDVERKVRAMASNLKESGERVAFDLEFPLSLKEFGLKAPSILGIIRVADNVAVKTTFTLTVSRSP
ncbi:MAG: YceI family protein [Verrucomicrobiota bacterium]